FLISAPVIAQTVFPEHPAVCGVPELSDPRALEEAAGNTLAKYPHLHDILRKRTETPARTDWTVGEIDTFWVFNFQITAYDMVLAELMASGPTSYVWVSQDDLWGNRVTMTEVEAILGALETRTPAASLDSSKGILELTRGYFGNPPNINRSFFKGQGDGKSHFLICDIKDGWNGSGGYIAGFFNRGDVDPGSGNISFSNRRDLLYIDSYPGIYLDGIRNAQRPLGTLAHEFQHLIHWNYDPSEIKFFDEGLSEFSEYLCGYGLRSPAGYLRNPNVSFLAWRLSSDPAVLDDYSRAALWTLYLSEQFGETFLRGFTQHPDRGIAGFDAAQGQSGTGNTFAEVLAGFHTANVLRDRAINPAFGYIDTTIVTSLPRLQRDVFGAFVSRSRSGLVNYAADYVRFRAADTIRVSVTPTAGSVAITAVRFRDDGVMVRDVFPGTVLEEEFVGSGISDLALVIRNLSGLVSAAYSLQSTGVSRDGSVLELVHDDGVTFSSPNLNLSNNDTVFVAFGGVDGGQIDSVRFWFASPGTARLLIRGANPGFTLDNTASRLGAKARMPSPVNFTVSDTTFFGTSVDVRSFGVRSDGDFVVQVIFGPAGPDPLLRRDNSQSTLTSYLSLAAQPTPGRVMYASLGDFYARVYLSPSDSLLLDPSELPQNFVLYQNFPNPFNPSTTITYEVPRPGHVRLAVFDLLGREIAVLVDGDQDTSVHSVQFDASGLAAGVYFYRLRSADVTLTRKMVVLR
ncbi:MAG: T9SS type A sorting domain-containing protein, partial [Bacteroidota bacterium]